MVELLKKTWKIIYADENFGMQLFLTYFEIFPDALLVFKFKDETDLQHSSRLKNHTNTVTRSINLMIT